jgi:hypothetical protein
MKRIFVTKPGSAGLFVCAVRIVSLPGDELRVMLFTVFLRGAFLLHRKQCAFAHARNLLAAPRRPNRLLLAIRKPWAGVTLQKQSRKTSRR